jgi:excisionase family DNA binding protein
MMANPFYCGIIFGVSNKRLRTKANEDEGFETALAKEAANLKCLTRKSAAKLLDCHISYIDRLIATGRLKSRKFGRGCIRIPLTEIKHFLSNAPTK